MRILSLDGGGMRGVYACAYLAALEEQYGVRLHEQFDMVVGTSTGGIIALGVGAEKSAAEILDFYRRHGPLIFPPGGKVRKFLSRVRLAHCYDPKPLRSALDEVFGERTMSQAATMLCVPSVDASQCHPTVFKSSSEDGLTRDLHTRMADVALATSSAPWFFPIAAFGQGEAERTYIDGGLWANNPAMIGLVEATRFHCGDGCKHEGVEMLSVGLPASKGFKRTLAYRTFPWRFVPQLLEYSMEAHKIGIDKQVGFLLEASNDLYFRVEPTNVDASEKRHLDLDSASPESIAFLTRLGYDDAQRDKLKPALRTIFARTNV